MKLIIAISSLLITNLIYGQINYNDEDSNTFQTGNIDSPFLRVSAKSGNKIKGNIYLNENWSQAIITDIQSKKSTQLARFNAYHSEIEIFKDSIISSLVPSPGLKVILNKKVFMPIKLKENNETVFAEVLVDDKNKLFKVYDVKINRGPSDAKLLNIESIDKVVIISKLYFNKDNYAIKLPNSKKDFQKNVPVEIVEIAKTEKLSIKNEKDLIKLFQISNTKN